MDLLKFKISSRQEFQGLLRQDQKDLTDLECALRFLYLQLSSFSGKVLKRGGGGFRFIRSMWFNTFKIEAFLKALYRRLAGVTIEHLNWSDFMLRYDKSNILFYFDLPYWCVEDYCGKYLFQQ